MKVCRKLAASVIMGTCTMCLYGCNVKDVKDQLANSKVTELDAAGSLQEIGRNEFVFDESKVVKHLETEYADSKYVYLYLGDSIFYPVVMPDNMEYVTDNSKFIYAKDNSVSVTVVSGMDIYNFSESAIINDAETLTQNLIATSDPNEKKDVLQAALYVVNDKAIIVRTVSNRAAFNVILEGLKENNYCVSKYDALVPPSSESAKKLPQYSETEISVTAGLGEQTQKIYSFESGSCLTVSRELRKFEDAIAVNETRMAAMAKDCNATVYYKDAKKYYAEVGDYVLGIYNVNFNTVLTCFGYGDEAKANAVAFILAQDTEKN